MQSYVSQIRQISLSSDLLFFEDFRKWQSLFVYLKERKMQDEQEKSPSSQNSGKASNANFSSNLRSMVISSIWKVGKSVANKYNEFKTGNHHVNSGANDTEEENVQLSDKEVSFLVLEEINFYLISVGINHQLSSDIIIQLA